MFGTAKVQGMGVVLKYKSKIFCCVKNETENENFNNRKSF